MDSLLYLLCYPSKIFPGLQALVMSSCKMLEMIEWSNNVACIWVTIALATDSTYV